VGRHAAGDGADVHPIVAAALEQRPTVREPGTARHGHEQGLAEPEDGEGGLGWPGEPGNGSGLGWPADESAPAAPRTDQAAPSRRGWRRVFGGRAA